MLYVKRCFCLLLVLLFAAACSPGSNPYQLTATPGPALPAIDADKLPKDANGIPIVAQVDGTNITLPQYERMIQRYQAQPVANPAGIPKEVLQTMIQQVLIDEQASKNNITVTDQEVNAELQGLETEAGGKDGWQTWLTNNNYTEDELRATLRDTLLTSMMRDRITGDLTGKVPQVHARHILVATEDQANQLLVRLRNGEDFATLAAQNSLDTTTSVNGGDLGWFTEEELLEPELAKVAFQLQPGQIAGPIQTSLGYDIIQTLEKDDRLVDPDKRAQLAQNRFENWLSTLTATAKIQQYI